MRPMYAYDASIADLPSPDTVGMVGIAPYTGFAMGYFATSQPAVPKRTSPMFLVGPKTHTPVLRLQGRGSRYYSPGLGRWISRDPIGIRGGRNLYAFARNDSVNRVDPYGLIHWAAIAAALLEGAGIVVDAVSLPDWIDDQLIDSYGGPQGFMDATERELQSKGGALPRDMFAKARAKDSDAINGTATGNEKDLHDRLQAQLRESKLYKDKRDFIIKRLQEGTLYQGFINVDFQDAGESSLGYAIGGGQLHYLYKFPPPTLELRLIDRYDFKKGNIPKGHMWGRLEQKGFLVPYDVNVMIETIPCPKAVREKK
jgi:RHS repeat-associated protein